MLSYRVVIISVQNPQPLCANAHYGPQGDRGWRAKPNPFDLQKFLTISNLKLEEQIVRGESEGNYNLIRNGGSENGNDT